MSSNRKNTKLDASDNASDEEPKIKHRPWRFLFVAALMFTVGGLLSFRALDIQVLENDFLQEQGNARHLRTVTLPAHRGMILDRNNEVLAVSTPVGSVWANPQDLDFSHSQINTLSQLIDIPEKKIKSIVNKKMEKEFVYLKRHIAPQLAQKIKDLDIPGVYLQREYRRYYPAGEVVSHIIGFTNIDDAGLEGVELQLNDRLQGKPGKDRVLKDRKGRIIESVDLIEAPQAGQEIKLSIDKRLQYIAYRELKKTVKQHGAKSGTLVILDVNTGEVLAMVNEPAYNPNMYRSYKKSHLRNRAVTDVFEPGSTIKPFVVAAALQTNQVAIDTSVNTSPGYFRVGKNMVRDGHDYGELDITGVIRKSSNVGISKIALSMPSEVMWEFLSDVGFGELSRSRFPGEAEGYLPFYGEWKDFTQATVSFGYGISVTSLQLAQSYAVLANGGYLKPISFEHLKREPKGKQVLSKSVSQAVLEMMETVVSTEGTAVRAKIPGYRVAGKTGTVKKLSPTGGYAKGKYLSIFAGIAPVNKPRFAAVVMIDDPSNGDYYGGKVAAPLFSSVIAEALRIMNVAPDDLRQPLLRVASIGGEG